jgi:hypothetical protein
MGRIAIGCRMLWVSRPANLWLEGGLCMSDESAETDDHSFEHMIAADTQLVAEDLHARVSAAQMPGEADEINCRTAFDLGKRFDTAFHAHNRSIVEDESVALPQHGCVRQVQQKTGAPLRGQHKTAAMPIVGAENHVVDGGRVPLACRLDFAR